MRKVLLLLLLAAPAHAGPEEAAPFVACGAQAWKAGKFKAARVCYEQAFAHNPDPRLRYNLARLSEELRDTDAAIAHYRAYLGTKNPEKGALAKARLKQLEAQARAREVKSATAPEPRSQVVEWSMFGAGLGAVAIGGVLHALAWSEQDDADAIRREMSADLATFQAAEDRAHNLQIGAFVGYGLGAALVLTGGYLLLVQDTPPNFVATPSGVGFAF